MKRSPSYCRLCALGLSLMIVRVSTGVATPTAGGNSPGDSELVDYVNPFVGTAGPDPGNTFPGASVPFGMVQWSPDRAWKDATLNRGARASTGANSGAFQTFYALPAI